MAPTHYTRIVFNERPQAHIEPNTFRKEVVPFDLKPGKGEMVVKTDWLSLDPAMRSWLRDTRSYIEPVKLGEVMRAGGLGTVVAVGDGARLRVGDVVEATPGWTEYAVLKEKGVKKLQVPPGAQALDFLGPLGMTGLTAYFGLIDVGKIKAGETLVVSGAAGAVGSFACQIGKIKGAKVIAIAGTDEKCQWLEKDLGVDKAVNYKSPTFAKEFKEAAGYFDIFFDNVGGNILDLALSRMQKNARVILCGAISDYNAVRPKGLSGYMNLISQRAKIEGFIVFDYVKEYPRALKDLSSWIADGSLKARYHIVQGLEKAPEALPLLYNGGNVGKLVVQVSSQVPVKAKL
ncbi:alcohol dehydrogenase [Auriscalpium vulgare]|uniref:Alcohol dehydrogenase n=1 Tax=Auriscalpium vulgare TaxID=40419 RepID=A0ACB8R902_9AGAM|nr:alcohol dehydrogenase [Auriscalpium vulgare]